MLKTTKDINVINGLPVAAPFVIESAVRFGNKFAHFFANYMLLLQFPIFFSLLRILSEKLLTLSMHISTLNVN